MKGKKQQQTANISSDELTCNSYNTTEEEDEDTKKDSLYKIQLRKEKMNKFFIENPYLEGQLDLNSDDFYAKKDDPNGNGQFLEDMQNTENQGENGECMKGGLGRSNQFWGKIAKEVDSTYNIKKKTKAKTLDQIMKRINIFKSRLDTLDRNPILKRILERESDDDSDEKREQDEKEKKKKQNEEEEFEFYSFKKKMQFEYKNKGSSDKPKTQIGKKSQKDAQASTSKKRTNVVDRLVNNGNDFAEEAAINVTDNLQITFEHGKKLYNDLQKAKTEREYRRIAREHWKSFKTSYKANLEGLKQHQFIQKFVKENKKYNIYLPDFNQEKQKFVNLEEDEKKKKELEIEDEQIFTMIDKIMTGAVYQKWKSMQDNDI